MDDLTNTALENDVEGMEGWDKNYLNGDMLKLLRIDCKKTEELIRTSPMHRAMEEHKMFSNWHRESTNELAYMLVIHASAQAMENASDKNDKPEKKEKDTFSEETKESIELEEGGVTQRGIKTGSEKDLTADERSMIDELLRLGKNVEIIPRSDFQGEKTPDYFIDGVKTELKTLNGTSLNTPVKRIYEGFRQGASTVIIDARKTGLTLEQAEVIISRAKGKMGGNLPGNVEIWTTEGILKR